MCQPVCVYIVCQIVLFEVRTRVSIVLPIIYRNLTRTPLHMALLLIYAFAVCAVFALNTRRSVQCNNLPSGRVCFTSVSRFFLFIFNFRFFIFFSAQKLIYLFFSGSTTLAPPVLSVVRSVGGLVACMYAFITTFGRAVGMSVNE